LEEVAEDFEVFETIGVLVGLNEKCLWIKKNLIQNFGNVKIFISSEVNLSRTFSKTNLSHKKHEPASRVDQRVPRSIHNFFKLIQTDLEWFFLNNK